MCVTRWLYSSRSQYWAWRGTQNNPSSPLRSVSWKLKQPPYAQTILLPSLWIQTHFFKGNHAPRYLWYSPVNAVLTCFSTSLFVFYQLDILGPNAKYDKVYFNIRLSFPLAMTTSFWTTGYQLKTGSLMCLTNLDKFINTL